MCSGTTHGHKGMNEQEERAEGRKHCNMSVDVEREGRVNENRKDHWYGWRMT